MNVYKPYINNDFSLEENYRSLFDNLRKRYVDTRLIDFQCDQRGQYLLRGQGFVCSFIHDFINLLYL